MKIEIADINSIKPYENNPRKLSEQAIEKVAMSLKEYGFRQPIVVDKDRIIVVGHTRFRASKKLGFKEVPITIADNLTPEQINGYRIADNRTSQESEWDFQPLQKELSDLADLNFNLELTGFNDSELDNYITFENDVDIDLPDIPNEDKKPFQQITFTLHNTQFDIVKNAIDYIKKQNIDDTINDNRNGNAITEICKLFYEKVS
jgi:ParB family transcriptional regulator, chromosome partitioning protein